MTGTLQTCHFSVHISTGGKGGSASNVGDLDPADDNNYGTIELVILEEHSV